MSNKEKQEVSLIGRLLSLEAAITVMGIGSLWYGIAGGKMMSIFYGVIILVAVVVLTFVRKKDWQKHWEEQERMHLARKEYERRKRDEQKK